MGDAIEIRFLSQESTLFPFFGEMTDEFNQRRDALGNLVNCCTDVNSGKFEILTLFSITKIHRSRRNPLGRQLMSTHFIRMLKESHVWEGYPEDEMCGGKRRVEMRVTIGEKFDRIVVLLYSKHG